MNNKNYVTISIDIDNLIVDFKKSDIYQALSIGNRRKALDILADLNLNVMYLEYDKAFEKACDFIHFMNFDISNAPDYDSVIVSDFMDIYADISDKKSEGENDE